MTVSLNIEIVRRTLDMQVVEPAVSSRAFVSVQRAKTAAAARATLEEAARVAERHVETARADADKLRDAARCEGHSAGERAWTTAALDLAERRAILLGNVERECVMLALEIARQILGAALEVDRSLVDAIAQRACAPLKRDGTLVLRVAPADGDRVDAIRERLSPAGPVAFEIDPALASGECIAECAGVRVDGRFDVQLGVLEKRLLERPIYEDRQ